MTETLQEQKMAKAYTILANGDRPNKINEITFTVPSQSGNWLYNVVKQDEEWHCDCPDHNKREADCKHIYTVKFWLNLKDNLKEQVKESKPLNFQACDKCGSYDIIKHGTRKTKQGKKTRLMCKDCNHTFVLEEQGFKNMKFDSEIVAHALDLYFNGVSLRKIEHHFTNSRGMKIDHSTIYKWVKKYCKIVSEYVDTLEPMTGDTWHADEMMVKVREGGVKNYGRGKSQYVWLWNCMDADTRFLLANQVTKQRSIKDVRRLFKKAKDVSDSRPEYIITDGLPTYPKGFKKEFRTMKTPRIKHLAGVGLTNKTPNNKVERLHGSIRQREKVMRGMQNVDTSDALMDGYRVHYNFVREHMGIDGMTPAEKAKIDLELGNNKWHSLIKKAVENKTPEKIEAKKEIKVKEKMDYWV